MGILVFRMPVDFSILGVYGVDVLRGGVVGCWSAFSENVIKNDFLSVRQSDSKRRAEIKGS